MRETASGVCGLLLLALALAAVGPACGQLAVGGNVTVQVPRLGGLQGSVGQTARGGRPFAQFLGVRYAQPPARFQAPVAAAPWNVTLAAVEHKPACVQFTATGDASRRHPAADVDPTLIAMAATPRQVSDSEDCLFLDIYTPNVTGRLPVLVYIHGGAFVGGSSQQVRPHFLLDHDLVLVAPQYRLGPLGFLSLQTAAVAGNAGLLDQVLALRWVRDHIASFGGDPAQVTVAGGSAGAASAALLQLSPLSQQPAALFHRVYLESGSALAPWSIEDDPVTRAGVVAVAAGCPGNPLNWAACLRNRTVEQLRTGFVASAVEDMLSGGTGLGGALPVVQASASAGPSTRVLPRRPLQAVRAASYRALPMLVGVTKHEGMMPLTLLKIYKRILDATYNRTDFYKNKTINDLVRRVMMIEENRVATDAVAEKYFKPGSLSSIDAMTPSLVDLAGAVHFKGPALSTVEFNSKTGNNTYLYAFNHQDNYNFDAVNHCADFAYLFPQPNVNLTAEEEGVSQKLVQLVANFVIHGNPTATGVPGVPAWPAYTEADPAFLLVDRAPQLRRDFQRQLTVAATEGLQKQASAAATGSVAGVAMLLAAATAALTLH